jgi:predicted naringenin-chalcone synthase
MPNNGNYS